MEHSECIKCGKEIHRDIFTCTLPSHRHPDSDQWGNPLNGWYCPQGMLCTKFRGPHIPRGEEMTGYTAREIRTAVTSAGLTSSWADEIVTALENPQFADSGTVTVKEVREAVSRMFPDDRCGKCGTPFHGKDKAADAFLAEIFSHREPDYPANSVWKAADDVIWLRVSDYGGRWAKFGSEGIHSHNTPKRPLKRMDVI